MTYRLSRNTTRCRRPAGVLLAVAAAIACAAPVLVPPAFGQGAPARPDSLEVVDLLVEGNATIPDAAILRHVSSQIGRPASSKQVLEDARALFELRWFTSVEPKLRYTEQGVVVVFKVQERPIVTKVEYRGNYRLKTKLLHALTGLRAGSPYDISANVECVRRIKEEYKKKGHSFAEVRLVEGDQPHHRRVIFDIKEGPKTTVRNIVFEGNDFFTDATLRLKVKSKRSFLGLPLGPLEPNYDTQSGPDDVNSLKQYYQSLGFFDVKVRREVRFNLTRTQATLVFHVQEGPRFRVRSISLEGNRVLKTALLTEEFELHSGEYFDSRKMTLDVDGIRLKYGELGRIFATVDAIPRFLANAGEVDLVYKIDEDRPYIIRDMRVHIEGGNPRTRPSVILDRALVTPGELANQVRINRGKQMLLASGLFLQDPLNAPRVEISKVDNGWDLQNDAGSQLVRAQSHVRPELAPQTTRLPASLTGPPVVGSRLPQQQRAAVGREVPIRTIGLPAGQPAGVPVMQREAAENEPLQPVIRAQNFNNLGQPQDQATSPFYGSDPAGDPFENALNSQDPGWIDLDYYVSENRTGRIMFGAGYNSDAGVVGSVTVSESNFDITALPRSVGDLFTGNAFRGGGQNFRLELVPGDVVSRYMVSWTDPYFLNSDYSLTTSAFYFNRFFPDWDEERVGGRIGIGRRLSDYVSFSVSLRAEDVEITNPTIGSPAEITNVVGSNLLTTARFAMAYDTRDNSFLPTEGNFVEAGYEQAFGDFDFGKATLEGRQFFTTWERPDGTGKHVLSIGGETGVTSGDTPVYEQYFAGGYNTFRGFAFRGVTPRTGTIGTGGTFSFLGTVEYRVPVTANDAFAVVAFSDFGTVENGVGFDNFRATAGFGFRLQVDAMGSVPLAFDFAFPLAKEVFDDTRVFSFYVGITR